MAFEEPPPVIRGAAAAPDAPRPSAGHMAPPTDNDVQVVRARVGVTVVAVGDVVIVTVAIVATALMAAHNSSSASIVSVVTAAFTAIGTLTTAYFGIRATSNTAQAVTGSNDTRAEVRRNRQAAEAAAHEAAAAAATASQHAADARAAAGGRHP